MDYQMTVGIATLGCKVNQYESEAIAEALKNVGLTVSSASDICDAYVINTCTVTSESDRKARQMIRRMIAQNPEAYIAVTGCYSQISPEKISAIAGVDYICGTANKMTIIDKLLSFASSHSKNSVTEICIPNIKNAKFEDMSIKRFDRTRAYVKIEDGCQSRCTYCTIPLARGIIRSKPFDDVINEVRDLTNNGCREIVLTGIETGSYGADLPSGQDLASLLCAIDGINGIGRVRLGSLDPSVIKPKFVEKISGLKSLAPHFHLSLQSGSDRILALMKRKYNSAQAMNSIELLKSSISNVKFTTDIIVGFPNESEDDFSKSCEFAKEAEFLTVHVFPYSRRSGTPAADMPNQIADHIKHKRVHILSDINANVRAKILERTVIEAPLTSVLFESYEAGYAYGHTPDFIEVKVISDKTLHGQIKPVRLISSDGNTCQGELCDSI